MISKPIKLDKEALNEAAWVFWHTFTDIMGPQQNGKLFNSSKQLIIPAIEAYLKNLKK